jgi:hypothetical protein
MHHRSSTSPIAHLDLVIDAFRLSRVEDGGCRFCVLLCQALDGSVKGWRKAGVRLLLHAVEKGTITLQVQGPDAEFVLLEIYAQSGMCTRETLFMFNGFFLLASTRNVKLKLPR